jgi:hypothetical protein
VARVDVEGAASWLLADDRDVVGAAPAGTIEGVRLLPPGDPFLQSPDREVLVPDPTHRRRLWRSRHAPGALLIDGEVVGTWRARRKPSRVDVAVEPFHPLTSDAHTAIDDAAQALALVWDTERATVAISVPPSPSP